MTIATQNGDYSVKFYHPFFSGREVVWLPVAQCTLKSWAKLKAYIDTNAKVFNSTEVQLAWEGFAVVSTNH